MKRIGLLLAMVVILVMGFVATAAAIEERNETYFYDRYEFSASGFSGLISLSYVVPAKDMSEKGLFGALFDIIKKVVEEQ